MPKRGEITFLYVWAIVATVSLITHLLIRKPRYKCCLRIKARITLGLRKGWEAEVNFVSEWKWQVSPYRPGDDLIISGWPHKPLYKWEKKCVCVYVCVHVYGSIVDVHVEFQESFLRTIHLFKNKAKQGPSLAWIWPYRLAWLAGELRDLFVSTSTTHWNLRRHYHSWLLSCGFLVLRLVLRLVK